MSILKLEPGQKVLFPIANVEEVEGNFGPQLKFTSTAGDVMFLNIDAAIRQLGRIGLELVTSIGQTVEFERVTKDGKKYTNINKPGAQKLAASNVPQPYSAGPHIPQMDGPLPEPESQVPKINKALSLYTLCWKHAVELAKQDLGNDATHEGISAQAATMYIQMCQRGLAA